MAQSKYFRPQREVSAVVGADITELSQRVETAAHGSARYAGLLASETDGHVAALLRKRAYHSEAARERGHEIRITAVGLNFFAGRSRGRRRRRWLSSSCAAGTLQRFRCSLSRGFARLICSWHGRWQSSVGEEQVCRR